MRIGITCFFQHSIFSSGGPTLTFSLADALRSLGHEITLVSLTNDKDWYDDAKALSKLYSKTSFQEFDTTKKLDVLIDIDGYIVSEQRKKIANYIVVFYKKPAFLNEMECSVYPIIHPIRDLNGVDAIWHWDTSCKTDTRFLELLGSIPVYRIPFTWSPGPTEIFVRESGIPDWLSVSEKMPKDHPWEAHICETNSSMGSNCTIPLVILSYVKKKGILNIKKYGIHNADSIKDNEFFRKNVYDHCQVADLEPIFLGRQRCADWRIHPKSFVVAHQRFMIVKPYLLDLAWNGIPVIHNSPYLRDLGHGLERFYYADNSINGAAEAIKNMNADYDARSGFFSKENSTSLKKKILEIIAPQMEESRLHLWLKALGAAEEGVANPKVFTPNEKSSTSSVPPSKVEIISQKKKIITIGFSDMWDDFNPEYNFFTLLLDTAIRSMNMSEGYEIKGVDATKVDISTINLLLFGPFGSFWQNTPSSIPKVHFTGENTEPIHRDDIFLNLGYKAHVDDDKGYIRLPLWMLEVDWFGANKEKIVNPKPLPLDRCCKVFPDEAKQKDRFCAFVVTNPTNPVRNNAFHWLSMYKKVDSAGRLFNTVGSEIFAGLGGGGGELKKHHFLRKYKFCLAYENSSSFGYTTEKWLHAKAAGCIPIYWGDPFINRDFDCNGFLNAQKCNSPEDLIALVKSVDENDELYQKMLNIPALDDYRRDLVRRRLSELANRLLSKALNMEESMTKLPRFLGATTDAEAAELRKIREGDSESVLDSDSSVSLENNNTNTTNTTNNNTNTIKLAESFKENTIFVSFATDAYISSVIRWVQSVIPHKQHSPTILIKVYLGEDVSTETLEKLQDDVPFVEWIPCPTKEISIPGFSDLWAAKHFAWKLWILQTLVKDSSLNGKIIWYMDAGCVLVRWANGYLEEVAKSGISFLEDSRQKNDQWCSHESRQIMKITDEELSKQQIWAGSLAFVAGNKKATDLFEEAWKFGCIRDVIVGPKWSGTLPDGRPYGHRHDQSILSILSQRYGVSKYPLDEVYCHESLRRTYQMGASIYCHRGNFKVHVNSLPRIGDIHLINLPRRKDRLERFKNNHPEDWIKNVCIKPAVDGRALNMTTAIARLFAPNDFKWKKAILGCALSHLSLWKSLANETSAVENYLILEDDVKFAPGWVQNIWMEASKHIPDDYDVLYLGGVLPPNREAFKSVLEPVNNFWARVLPNTIFRQPEPTTYFHFCNYSYILTKAGAKKVLDSINSMGGYFTSADHMICNQIQTMKHYVLIPQVAGCYQDDDPKYQTSVFNDFNRIDGFDSDLWNNDERWTIEELNAVGPFPMTVPIDEALLDVQKQMQTPQVNNDNVKKDLLGCKRTEGSPRFLTLQEHIPQMENFLEKNWLSYLFGPKVVFTFSQVSIEDEPANDKPIFLVQRPWVNQYKELFQKYEAAGKEFYVLHLSDEYCSDDISFYSLKNCKGVVRTYPRNLPSDSKIVTIPLGYAKHAEAGIDTGFVDTPSLPFREKVWSFHGTRWMHRQEKLEPLKGLQPNTAVFFNDWNDAKQLKETEYIGVLLNSIFVPCPRGQNSETFRFYEAIEHGAIPIYVREEGDEEYFKMISMNLPMINLPSWVHAYAVMKHMNENRESLDKYRLMLLVKWREWKKKVGDDVKRVFNLV